MQLFEVIILLIVIIAIILMEHKYSPRLDLVYSYNKRVLLLWYNHNSCRKHKVLYEW